MKKKSTYILIFFISFLSLNSQNYFITPANNSIYSKYSSIELIWDSKGLPVDLFYATDGGNWIEIIRNYPEDNYIFQIPQDATNTISFKIEFSEFTDASLVWEMKDAHQDEIRTAMFSANGKFIYTGSRDNTIKKWNIAEERLEWEIPSDGIQNIIYDIEESKDSKNIVVARSTKCQLYDENANLINEITNLDECRSVAFSEDGNYFALANSMGYLAIYQLNNDGSINQINSFEFGINQVLYSCEFSQNNNYVVVSSTNNVYTVANPTTQNNAKTTLNVSNATVWEARISYDKDYIFYSDTDGNIGEWLHADKKEVFSENIHENNHIRALVYNSFNNKLLTGSLDGTAKEYDLINLRVIRTIEHNGQILDVDYTETADSILTVGRLSDDNSYYIKVWSDGKMLYYADSITIQLQDFATVYVNDIQGIAGDKRNVQVSLLLDTESETVLDVSFDIDFPAKLLEPEIDYTMNGFTGIIHVEKQIAARSGEIFNFDALLLESDISSDSIYIRNFQILNRNYVINTDNGFVEILDYCPGTDDRAVIVNGNSELIQIIENPVNGILSIDVNFVIDGDYSLEILNLTGEVSKLIFQGYKQHSDEVIFQDINDLATGVYFVRLSYEDREYFSKFIKE